MSAEGCARGVLPEGEGDEGMVGRRSRARKSTSRRLAGNGDTRSPIVSSALAYVNNTRAFAECR